MKLSPFLTRPIYQPWIWGGRNLARVLGRELPPEGPVAESWEVSDVDGAVTEIDSGPHVGRNLRDLVAEAGGALLGTTRIGFGGHPRRFPLLVKYLDAQDILSIQVHPDDEYAARQENGSPGKTEMWLVLEAAPDAEVIAGLRPGVGKKELRAALREDRMLEVVRRYRASAGDVILVPAGRAHSLGKGIVALEIQQTSSITYRLYDWGRIGPDGKQRQLHIEQSLDAIHYEDVGEPKLTPVVRSEIWGRRKLLAVTAYFLTELWDTRDSFDPIQPVRTCTTGHSPDVLMLIAGRARVRWDGGTLEMPRGRTAVIPTMLGSYTVELFEPSLLARSRVPDMVTGLGEWNPVDTSEERRVQDVCDRSARHRFFGGS